MIGLGRATGLEGDRAHALVVLEEAAQLSRELGDIEGVGRCLGFIGHVYLFRGDKEKAAAVLDEGVDLARSTGDASSLQRALSNAAAAALELPDFDRARAMYEESLELARTQGLTFSVGLCTTQLGFTLLLAGDYAAAEAQLKDAVDVFSDLGDTTWTQLAFRYQGLLALMRGDLSEAEPLLLASLAKGRDQAPGHELLWWIEDLAAVADAKGDALRAATLWGAADALYETPEFAILEESRQLRERFRSDALDADAWERGHALSLDDAIDFALGG
jgi:tetratricopeptide (TPR) repeat protein